MNVKRIDINDFQCLPKKSLTLLDINPSDTYTFSKG